MPEPIRPAERGDVSLQQLPDLLSPPRLASATAPAGEQPVPQVLDVLPPDRLRPAVPEPFPHRPERVLVGLGGVGLPAERGRPQVGVQQLVHGAVPRLHVGPVRVSWPILASSAFASRSFGNVRVICWRFPGVRVAPGVDREAVVIAPVFLRDRPDLRH